MRLRAPDDAVSLETRSGTAPDHARPATARLHASCVEIQNRGVLLLGASGSGKSDLAARLIDGGAVLVADDQVWLTREEDRLIARPAEALAGLIEVRGVGILRLPFRAAVPLALVVELEPGGEVPRLPDASRRSLLGIELPRLRLDPRKPSAAAIVRLALRAERCA